MLSPHEVATLMLVQGALDHTGLDRADLEALREHQLIYLGEIASGRRPCITPKGGAVLEAITRTR
ncbi:hypothetical protein AB4Z48_17580 [Cupriavidus sp. 2TAF22]|uniref:hypothetical protein n=1 Tax=unclassified Cupriavidus TaxID=2640874 RepID=UPI003F8DEFC2